MPIDNHTAGFIAPILDFTSKQNFFGDSEFLRADGNYGSKILSSNPMNKREVRILQSGGNATENATENDANSKRVKRSVSETKKKFVAARQNWRCGKCTKHLPAWFEVDHKIRLEHGGSNHVDNLEALCRDCHGEKTAIENL
jgi:5-methylcytosine-specific restriction endonuclease McrA